MLGLQVHVLSVCLVRGELRDMSYWANNDLPLPSWVLAKQLLGKVEAPSFEWLATLQQAWRYVHQDSRVSSPSLIPNYLNFSMTCFLQFRKYSYSGALAYVLALRGELVNAGLDSRLLNELAFLQGYTLP